MVRSVKRNNDIIKVTEVNSVQSTYHGKEYKTLEVNKDIKLVQRDRIIYICDTCKKEVEERFNFNNKFFTNNQNCRECDISKTKTKKYGTPNAISEIKKGFNNKYGVDNPSQIDWVKKKKEYTFISNYGVRNNFASDEIKNKLYGTDGIYLNNIEQSRNTLEIRYGHRNPSQIDWVKNKKKKTCLKNYGVEYPYQDKDIMGKAHSMRSSSMSLKKIDDNLHYQTLPELRFIDYCNVEGVKVEDGPTIQYTLNNKKHIYHIDFETDKYLIEIKSSHHWYYRDVESGKLEAKNYAAKQYADTISKKFIFLLDINDYNDYMESNNVKLR